MVDLVSQYDKIKGEVGDAIEQVMSSAAFINGPEVQAFKKELSELNLKTADSSTLCASVPVGIVTPFVPVNTLFFPVKSLKFAILIFIPLNTRYYLLVSNH